MTYSIKRGSIRAGRKDVPVFIVVDERGMQYAHEDTQQKAEAHIELLKVADARNAEAATQAQK